MAMKGVFSVRKYKPPPKGVMNDNVRSIKSQLNTTKKNYDVENKKDRQYQVFFLLLSSISTLCILTIIICWLVYAIFQ